MASTIIEVVKLGGNSWRYDFSGVANFKLYQDGILLQGDPDQPEGETDDTSRSFENNNDFEPPIIEIQDSTEFGNTPQMITNPPFILLQWRGTLTDEGHYLIEEEVSSVWVVRNRVVHNRIGYYQWTSLPLADTATHHFRISAIDDEEHTGATIQYDAFMVRNPDAPSISASYDAGTGNLTIAAR